VRPVERELQRNSQRKRQYRVTKQCMAECYRLCREGKGRTGVSALRADPDYVLVGLGM